MNKSRYALLALGAALAVLLLIARNGNEPKLIPENPVFATVAMPTADERLGSDTQETEHSDVDASLTTQRVDGLSIEDCEPPAPVEPYSNEQFGALLQQAGAALSKSSETDFLVAAALLTSDADERQRLLERALTGRPGHPVALWHRLVNCQTRSCERGSIEQAALTGDSANGMTWFLIASDRIENGQWDDAEQALRQVAAADRYSLYFMEHAMLIERGLAATTDLGYPERIVAGLGVSAAIAIPALGHVSRACQSGDNDAVLWIELCDEVGQRMASHSDELITTMFGYGLRSGAAKRAGDDAGAETIKQEGNNRINGLLREQAQSGAQALMTNDPQVLQSYVENFLVHGELEAMDRLLADARRLHADPSYDQCNFVANPYTQP